jgi:hypothetical protein
MKLAVMQPYFFPYMGYWQLLDSADRFVVFDDVNYIVRGWVNRNRILIHGEPSFLTLPLCKASQNKLISEIDLQDDPAWRGKICKSIQMNYGKAPFFDEVFPLLEECLHVPCGKLVDLLVYQIRRVAQYLGIDTQIVSSSSVYQNAHLSGQDRIIDICKQEKTDMYINASGGRELYDGDAFHQHGLQLRFVQHHLDAYAQRGAGAFVPALSIIDVMMNNSLADVQAMLKRATLVA